MIKDNTPICIDLVCIKTNVQDVLNKDGQKISVTALYKGTFEMGDKVVTADLKFVADSVDIIELAVPFKSGAKRQMALSLTNEDLGNHI